MTSAEAGSGPGNRPAGQEVVLDHTGHFVRDAEAARAALVALGFTVTPFSAQVQPDPETGESRLTGTGNVCAMLPEGYLEFLVHTADTPLGLEFCDALERRAGLHLLAFGVAEAAERHAAWSAGGFDLRPLVHFSREVDTEEGATTAAFTVARLAAGAMPEGRVQAVTHHTVDAMWQQRWTGHANGARRLGSVVISAPDPDEAADRFARLLGRPALGRRQGWRIALDRGAVEILPEAEATALVGDAVEPGRSVLAAVRVGVGVGDVSRLAGMAASAGLPARRDGETVVIPFAPALGRGAWLFDPA